MTFYLFKEYTCLCSICSCKMVVAAIFVCNLSQSVYITLFYAILCSLHDNRKIIIMFVLMFFIPFQFFFFFDSLSGHSCSPLTCTLNQNTGQKLVNLIWKNFMRYCQCHCGQTALAFNIISISRDVSLDLTSFHSRLFFSWN